MTSSSLPNVLISGCSALTPQVVESVWHIHALPPSLMLLQTLSILRGLLAVQSYASAHGGDPLSGCSDDRALVALPVLVSLVDAQGRALVGDVSYVGHGQSMWMD